ncbi:MAG: type 4a pilus biogenesis protein PilO [Nitrospirae bacterium]|nr:type 4a pilus biogenesis protein PilO [Nitrospirota bacterium]
MRRSVAVIGVISVLGAIYLFFIHPLSDKRLELKETLSDKYMTLKKYDTLIKEGGLSKEELKKVDKELKEMEENIMQFSNESIALSTLHGRIEERAEKAGIKISSVRMRASIKYEFYVGVPIEVEAMGNIKEISSFLKSMDSGREFIKIERLDITKAGLRAEDETLRIKVQITGLTKI